MKTVEKPKNKGTQQKNGTEQKAVQKSSTKIDDVLKPTAESRIKKLQNFQILADKHKFLLSKNDELQKFIVSSDGTKEKIVLKNAQGFNLEISNSAVITEVVEVVKKKLETITKESENEVLTFSI